MSAHTVPAASITPMTKAANLVTSITVDIDAPASVVRCVGTARLQPVRARREARQSSRNAASKRAANASNSASGR